MNIRISKEEHEYLQQLEIKRFTIGSHLYGTAHAGSDMDYLSLYRTSDAELYSGLPNVHQFQYKDTAHNIDWNYCSELQFYKNLHSGEATINAEVVLFTDYKSNKLVLCRTYKIIKAYLGFARRDIKDIGKGNSKKATHATRGLYCAEMLLDGRLPVKEELQMLYQKVHTKEALASREQELRAEANRQYEAGLLNNYSIEDCGNMLWQKLLQSNNTREFRYGKQDL